MNLVLDIFTILGVSAVLGMGLAAGDKSASIAAAFYAMRHILVKGGLFLATGMLARSRRGGLWLVMVPAVLALGFGGLPLTGRTMAKLAIKAPLGGGAVSTIATLAAVGSTLLMLHFLRCLILSALRESQMAAPAGLVLPWLAIAVASVAAPLMLYPVIADARRAISRGALGSALADPHRRAIGRSAVALGIPPPPHSGTRYSSGGRRECSKCGPQTRFGY
jgi:formate hydrogenlyase subunit 3/multisubunit Na+/H+ antiporter MnhD subunit